MSENDEEPRKGSRNRKGRKTIKLSESSPSEGYRFVQSESLKIENSKIESDVMSDLGIQLIEAAKEPFDNGQEVKRLLDQGAPVNYRDKLTRATALHYAAGYNDVATVNIIMTHPGVEYLIRDRQGRLASELAEAVNPELAQLIIDKEAEQAAVKKIIPDMRHDEPIGGGSGNDDGPNL